MRYTLLMVAVLVTACGSPQATTPAAVQPATEAVAGPTDTMADTMADTPDTMADTLAATPDTMAATPDTMADTLATTPDTVATTPDTMATTPDTMADTMTDTMAQAAWLTLPLTDARTGASFTLADFAGRAVYVEPMATWCPKCRAQLAAVQEASDTLKEQSPVVVALSVETTLPPEQLAQYAADNGFDMVFAVASPELLQALVDTFGRTITNPPSTPHFIIAPDGSYSELMTGASSATDVAERMRAVVGGA
jgi:thiol-disulfide isomerase/thioredoxin